MQPFAKLLDQLACTQSRNRKIALLADYFTATPDPDRGWALAALSDGLPYSLPLRRILPELMAGTVDPELYRLSRDYVGDTAETVSLLWRDRRKGAASATGDNRSPPSISDVVMTFGTAPRDCVPRLLAETLDRLDISGRFALLKLLAGAPRVGVSARLAKTALAIAFEHEVGEIEEVWHAVDPPYRELFGWLTGKSAKPDPGSRPVFRPLMLAHPIEDEDWARLDPGELNAEWKWDGIRVQIAAIGGHMRLFSRTGDDISKSFPEIASAFTRRHCVVDGELLVVRNGDVAPFNDLQQRLNRKTVSARMLRDYPAHVRLYDLLFDAGEDLRGLPFEERRKRLAAWHENAAPPLTDLSATVRFSSFEELSAIWQGTRADGIEGLMLKRKSSPYLAGRPKGHWWKWKRAPLTLDCVLMYAQRGSGKRSSFYSDYTFGVWRDDGPATLSLEANYGSETDAHAAPGELVPVGKAYSGFTDEELRKLDRFVRTNTLQRFGPVRAVAPTLVLEVAFDAVQFSTRHKSGVAMRFPRIARIRWDKPAVEADTLTTIKALIRAPATL
ncbi:MAG: cisplatin damage response ATP-dependent DNA ligase [Alphaproteobacteria bacterium]|nr:cisplatin damage response ATP-dependent DNA ligase [Alphaproteobacteria bacterium]